MNLILKEATYLTGCNLSYPSSKSPGPPHHSSPPLGKIAPPYAFEPLANHPLAPFYQSPYHWRVFHPNKVLFQPFSLHLTWWLHIQMDDCLTLIYVTKSSSYFLFFLGTHFSASLHMGVATWLHSGQCSTGLGDMCHFLAWAKKPFTHETHALPPFCWLEQRASRWPWNLPVGIRGTRWKKYGFIFTTWRRAPQRGIPTIRWPARYVTEKSTLAVLSHQDLGAYLL